LLFELNKHLAFGQYILGGITELALWGQPHFCAGQDVTNEESETKHDDTKEQYETKQANQGYRVYDKRCTPASVVW
jgi:hypothetical protein